MNIPVQSHDLDEAINKKLGDTSIGTLRRAYSREFAPAFGDHEKLGRVWHRLDVRSLTKLRQDYVRGKL
jgi:hypothetical protein